MVKQSILSFCNRSPIIAWFLLGLLILFTTYILDLQLLRQSGQWLAWWIVVGACITLITRRFSPSIYTKLLVIAAIIFALDWGTQLLLRQFYGNAPMSLVLAEALANTNSRESIEFIASHWINIIISIVYAITIISMAIIVCRHMPKTQHRYPFWLILFFILLCIYGLLNRTMVRSNPIAHWGIVAYEAYQAKKDIQETNERLQYIEEHAANWQLKSIDPSVRTVIVVIGESDNRLNWHLYHYARHTTQPLEQALHQTNGNFYLFENAWSSDAFTQLSLTKALTPATKEQPNIWKDTPAITQIAKVAGFHTHWLSNQVGQEGWFAGLANHSESHVFINTGNWHDSRSTDDLLLPHLENILMSYHQQPELIVIHLLGQHFFYNQRCPKNIHPFRGIKDQITEQLHEMGRNFYIINERNDYDSAVYCGADVLGKIIMLAHQYRAKQPTAILYFSDHGQEVGHTRNFAGHSANDLTGYTIPMFLWTNPLWHQNYPQDIQKRLFRLDWVDHMISHLLGIQTRWYHPQYDLLSYSYQPKENAMPILHTKE